MNIPTNAVEAAAVDNAARALGLRPCTVTLNNWYSCGGDDDPTRGYRCSDDQCSNPAHSIRQLCGNPWHKRHEAFATVVASVRAAVADEIAHKIEAELVCGCISEAEEHPQWQGYRERGWSRYMGVRDLGVHEMCWWAWCSAEIAREARRGEPPVKDDQ